MYLPTKDIIHYKKRSEKDLFDDDYEIFFWFFDAIQMSTHNICLYKDVKKKYTGCNLKSTEFLDCALIGVCAVIRSNMVILKLSLMEKRAVN